MRNKSTPKPTDGPSYYVIGNRADGYILIGPEGSFGEMYIATNPENCKAKDNSEFVVNAFNVYHETGLTPRELKEQRDALLTAAMSGLSMLSIALQKLNQLNQTAPEGINIRPIEAAIAAAQGKGEGHE